MYVTAVYIRLPYSLGKNSAQMNLNPSIRKTPFEDFTFTLLSRFWNIKFGDGTHRETHQSEMMMTLAEPLLWITLAKPISQITAYLTKKKRMWTNNWKKDNQQHIGLSCIAQNNLPTLCSGWKLDLQVLIINCDQSCIYKPTFSRELQIFFGAIKICSFKLDDWSRILSIIANLKKK